MMTYNCGHQGKKIPDKFLNSEIYHEWLNKKSTICFECHINQLTDKAIKKADSEACRRLENV